MTTMTTHANLSPSAAEYVAQAPVTATALNVARDRARDEPTEQNRQAFLKALLGTRFLTPARAIPVNDRRMKWDLPVLHSEKLGDRTPVFTSEEQFTTWATAYGADANATLSPVNPVSLFPLIDANDIDGFVIDPSGVNIPVSTELAVELLAHLALPENRLEIIGHVPATLGGLMRSAIDDALVSLPTIRRVWVKWNLSTMGYLFVLDLDDDAPTDIGEFGTRAARFSEGWQVHVLTAGSTVAQTIIDTEPLVVRPGVEN